MASFYASKAHMALTPATTSLLSVPQPHRSSRIAPTTATTGACLLHNGLRASVTPGVRSQNIRPFQKHPADGCSPRHQRLRASNRPEEAQEPAHDGPSARMDALTADVPGTASGVGSGSVQHGTASASSQGFLPLDRHSNDGQQRNGAKGNGLAKDSLSVSVGMDAPAHGGAAPLVPKQAFQDGQSEAQPSSPPPPENGPEPGSSYSDFYKGSHMRREPLMQPGSNSSSDERPLSHGGASSRKDSGSSGKDVADALLRAQKALDNVETSLEGIDRLPSARPVTRVSHLATVLSAARGIVLVGALSSALLASHAFGLVVQWLSAALGGAVIAAWGLHKGSLSRSGAAAAATVGLATLGCSLRFGAVLLAFFFSSSKLTQYKEEFKETLDDATKKGGQRNWVQVLCNAGIPTVIAIAYGVLAGCVDVPLGPLPNLDAWRTASATALMGAFLGYYSCCCGDTWASELGPLSRDPPRLITSMRLVRRGTNGGVTLLGLCASIAGGAFMGLAFYVAGLVSPTLFIFEHQHMAAIEQWRLIPLGLMAGLVGSVTDSVLGATLQYSGYNTATGRVTSTPGHGVQHIAGRPLLSNNLVNFLSASLTAALTALAALKVFGF